MASPRAGWLTDLWPHPGGGRWTAVHGPGAPTRCGAVASRAPQQMEGRARSTRRTTPQLAAPAVAGPTLRLHAVALVPGHLRGANPFGTTLLQCLLGSPPCHRPLVIYRYTSSIGRSVVRRITRNGDGGDENGASRRRTATESTSPSGPSRARRRGPSVRTVVAGCSETHLGRLQQHPSVRIVVIRFLPRDDRERASVT